MSNRRRHARYRTVLPVEISAPDKPGRIGVVHNLSAAGLLLATPSRFVLGQTLDLKFRVTMGEEQRSVRGTITRLSEAWEQAFPRRVAVRFDQQLPELEGLFDGHAEPA